MTTITALPTPPSRDDPDNFATRADDFLGALPTFATETNTVAGEVNSNASTASTAASTATTQASNASTSASTASTQASNASTSASNAATSETNAANYAAALKGTSTTSLAIATGSKTFTTQSGKQWAAGQFVVAVDSANSGNYMHGQVTSYATTSLVLDVQSVGGSGTIASWNIYVAGNRGATGAAGTGDVTGPAASVDSEIALFDSTTGKVLKRASITGIAKVTSGVLSAATAGTDYSGGTSALATGIVKSTTTTGALTIATGADLPSMTATVGGAVPTPPNNTTTFLRGDGTFASAGGGSWVYLSTVTASNSATVDIETTFDSTYATYALVISGLTVSQAATLQIRLKIDGVYKATGSYEFHHTRCLSSLSSYAASGDYTQDQIIMSGTTTSTAKISANYDIRIPNPSSTTLSKVVYWTGQYIDSATGRLAMNMGTGAWDGGTQALTGVRFFMSAGNIVSGTFRLYGIKNS